MEKNEIRGYILIRYNLGIECPVIHNELVLSFGDYAPCLRTVQRWVERFKSGDESIKDFERPGRPITAVTESNIKLIRDLIDEESHISYNKIEAATDISRPAIFRIIHDALKLRKLASRWIPHELTKTQKRKRVEICQKNLAQFKEGK